MNFKEIFKPATEEELKAYSLKRTESWRKEFFKRTDIKKNSDGSYDVEGGVCCGGLNLKSLTELGVKFNEVGRDFNCSYNQLKTLEGAPKSVGGDFDCYKNQLTTLEGAPKSVGGDFDCYKNQLTTLEGAPESIGGGFCCSQNQLKTLEGAPESVGGGFYCSQNQLKTLEGAPKRVDGGFCCSNQTTGIKFTEEQVRAVSVVKGKIFV